MSTRSAPWELSPSCRATGFLGGAFSFVPCHRLELSPSRARSSMLVKNANMHAIRTEHSLRPTLRSHHMHPSNKNAKIQLLLLLVHASTHTGLLLLENFDRPTGYKGRTYKYTEKNGKIHSKGTHKRSKLHYTLYL